jgi:glutaredoxin 3
MDIVMYSIPGCKYCEHAKELFKRANVDYNHYVVGKDITKTDLLKKYPLAQGYPYIIIDGEPIIGGLTATAKIFLEKGLVTAKKK